MLALQILEMVGMIMEMANTIAMQQNRTPTAMPIRTV